MARDGFPGTEPVLTTWGSSRNMDSASAHRIQSKASNFLLEGAKRKA
jgi:hypothetical protein